MFYYACLLSLSSPFLFVSGVDRVTCHMGADVVSGDTGDT